MPRDLRQDFLHGVHIGGDTGHPTLVLDLDTGHLTSACAHRDEGILEAEDARRDRRGVLSERVTRDHIGHDAVCREQTHQRDVDGQGRGLRYLGVPESLKLLLFGNVRVATNEVRQRATQLLGHDLVGFIKGGLNHWVLRREVETHVDVLRALSREQERDLAVRGGLLDVDASTSKHLHRSAFAEDLERAVDLTRLSLCICSGGRQTDGC